MSETQWKQFGVEIIRRAEARIESTKGGQHVGTVDPLPISVARDILRTAEAYGLAGRGDDT